MRGDFKSSKDRFCLNRHEMPFQAWQRKGTPRSPAVILHKDHIDGAKMEMERFEADYGNTYAHSIDHNASVDFTRG